MALTDQLSGQERGQSLTFPGSENTAAEACLNLSKSLLLIPQPVQVSPHHGQLHESQVNREADTEHASRTGLTRTTPSECPVTMTFCVSHSFISDTQQQTICWLLPVNVFTLTMGFPLMLHTWIYVPAQDTMSP